MNKKSSKTISPSYAVPALEKGILILEEIANAAVPLSLADLAQLLGKSRQELFRMLNCLVAMGYLRRDDLSGKYALTLKLFELSRLHSPIEKIKEASRLPLQKLVQTIRESVHLSLLSEGLLNVFYQIESPEKLRLTCEIGSSFDPFQTSSGKVLLSRLKPEMQLLALEKSLEWLKQNKVQKVKFLETLNSIAKKKIYIQNSDMIEGIEDRVIPIESPHFQFRVALAVNRFHQRIGAVHPQKIDEALFTAQKEILQALGIPL